MKKLLNTGVLPCLIALCGAAGAGLRYWMYRTAVDEKGLLMPWNLPQILLWILTGAVAALTLAAVWEQKGHNRYAGNFPASLPGAVGAVLLAVGIAAMLLTGDFGREDTLGKLRQLFGWISLPCLLLTAYGRMKGARPVFLLHGLVCAYFGFQLVDLYRTWSGNPQTADYLFQLMACVGLLITAYQRTAFEVGLGNRRAMQAAGMLAGFACILSCTEKTLGVFYLAGAVWCLTNLCAPVSPAPAEEGNTP